MRRTLFTLFIFGLVLASILLLFSRLGQTNPSPTIAPATSTAASSGQAAILKSNLPDAIIPHRHMRDIVDHYRKLGMRMCSETGSEPRAEKTSTIYLKNATIQSALEAAVAAYPTYTFELSAGTDIFFVNPRNPKSPFAQPLAMAKTPPAAVTQNWSVFVQKTIATQPAITYPFHPYIGIVPSSPADKKITFTFDNTRSVRETLALLCAEYSSTLTYEAWHDPQSANTSLCFIGATQYSKP